MVVDQLEPIQVANGDGKGRAIALAASIFFGQPRFGSPAVGQAGEHIGVGECTQFGLLLDLQQHLTKPGGKQFHKGFVLRRIRPLARLTTQERQAAIERVPHP